MVVQQSGRDTVAYEKMTSVDLSSLVQDVVETVHFASSVSQNTQNATAVLINSPAVTEDDRVEYVKNQALETNSDVVTLIDIDPSVDWVCKTDAGSWKRILMNILGNALKYTSYGRIDVKLRLMDFPGQFNSALEFAQCICLEVFDTGRGIKSTFLEHGIFEPFMQENSITEGTGLGMSIVHQLVYRLGGRVDIRSELDVGTEVTVLVPVGENVQMLSETPVAALLQSRLLTLDADAVLDGRTLELPVIDQPTVGVIDIQRASAVRELFGRIAAGWLGMKVIMKNEVGDGANSENIIALPMGSKWVLHLTKDGQSINIDVEQPYNPRKLASALLRASNWQELTSSSREIEFATISTANTKNTNTSERNLAVEERLVSVKNFSLQSFPETSCPGDSEDRPLHLLLVDDNTINLKFLGACAHRCGCTFAIATNGEEAVDVYKGTSSRFDLIFMDISMPVMDGCSASRLIRAFETTSGLPRTRIIALTALGNEDIRQEASSSGMDDFMVKPVPMAAIRELLKRLGPTLRGQDE